MIDRQAMPTTKASVKMELESIVATFNRGTSVLLFWQPFALFGDSVRVCGPLIVIIIFISQMGQTNLQLSPEAVRKFVVVNNVIRLEMPS